MWLMSLVIDVEDSATEFSTVSCSVSACAMHFLGTWQLTALLDACELYPESTTPRWVAGFESRGLAPLISISIYQSITRVLQTSAAPCNT